jgi:two-component system CheB/CheR fusion protein
MSASDSSTNGCGPALPKAFLPPPSGWPLPHQFLPLLGAQRPFLDLIPVAVYACEAPSGRITFYNKQATVLWGREPRIGDCDQRFCGSLRLWRNDGDPLPHDRTPMAYAVREGRAFRNEAVVIERPDGSRIDVLVNIDPVHDCAGRVVAAINSFHDVTALKAAEAAFRDSEQRLRLALEAGRMGTWEWDIRSNRVVWSPALEAIHGLAAGDFAGNFEAYRQDIHPEDRQYVERAIAATLQDGNEHHIEYRIVWRDGAVRWVEGRGKLFRDDAGRPVRMAGVCTDVTERKQAEAALRRTRDELKAADRRKDEFLAGLAHELRNPLAPLASGLQILRRVVDQPDKVGQCLAMMDRQFSQLVRLVDDLMEVSRITQGKVALRKQPVALAQILQQAVETSRPLIAERGHELVVDTTEQPIVLEADGIRLAQVVSNLLNNAAKYTQPGGRIRVEVMRCGGEAVVSVQDSGMGIAAHVLPRVFELFAQGDRSADQPNDGLGIGLMLVKQLVEMHGGTVTAESDGPGKGSRFVVRLPLAPSADPSGVGQPGVQEHGAACTNPGPPLTDDRDAASVVHARGAAFGVTFGSGREAALPDA